MNGGCPQGSLLGVIIFNVSTDDIELAPEKVLQELGKDEVHVGDFFDKADREYLRQNERRMLLLNETAVLIPGLHLPLLPSTHDTESEVDFKSKGSSPLPSQPDALLTSTPIRNSASPDFLAVGSPVNSSLSISEITNESEGYNYMPQTRNCLLYTSPSPRD